MKYFRSKLPSLARRHVLLAMAGVSLSACLDGSGLRLFDTDSADGFRTYRTKPDDTLVELAREFGLGYVELAAANPGIDPWVMGEGTVVRVPAWHIPPATPKAGAVVNLGDMRLYHYGALPKGLRSYPVGIGREGHESPRGTTSIVRKKAAPTWYPPASVRAEDPSLPLSVPPGPDNPLGTHALYLGWPTYLIHGTNIPWSVGRRASNGCVRLYPEHVTAFFDEAPLGLTVTVIDEPVKLAWVDDRLFLQAHPSQSQATAIEETGTMPSEPTAPHLDKVADAAGARAGELDWHEVGRIIGERRSYPVRIL